MFLILNSSNLIVKITEHAFYVKSQTNDVNISCSKEEAEAICSINSDKLYPVKVPRFITEIYTLAEINEIPSDVIAGYHSYHDGEFYMTEEKQAELSRTQISNDVITMIINLEYQLILLESEVDVNDASL